MKRIKTDEGIKDCEIAEINQFNWGGDYRPISHGQIGLLPDDSLLIHMWCEEENPATVYCKSQDPVYKDSALEFFIGFSQHTYYNFEINSAGAMLCQIGSCKTDRILLSQNLYEQISVKVSKSSTDWHVFLTLPLKLLNLDSSHSFSFNFYKIKESSGNMHFASYSPIKSETPNFHLPQYFAKGIVS